MGTKPETALVAIVGAACALAVACSSRTLSKSGRDVDADNGGSAATGGSQNAGGATGYAGSPQAGGARSTGGTRATGGSSGTGAGPAGGSPATGGAASDAGIDPESVRCTRTDPVFPTFDRACNTTADCVLVRHTTSCCGSSLFMAINHTKVARFQAAERICDAQYPACGCASQGASAEDGTLIPWGSENQIVASCDNNVCRSRYSGKTFACGTTTCTDQQVCSKFSGGPAGTPISYSCGQLGSCKSCACVDLNATPGCTCSESQGFITFSCAAP